MMVRLEMESFWLDLENNLEAEKDTNSFSESRNILELNQVRDKKYSPKFLPPNFYSNYLAKIPERFQLSLHSARYLQRELNQESLAINECLNN
jgi:hypothetical protein